MQNVPPDFAVFQNFKHQQAQLSQRDSSTRYVSKFVLCYTAMGVIKVSAKVTFKVTQGHIQ